MNPPGLSDTGSAEIVELFGLRLNNVDHDGAANAIRALLKKPGKHFVVTPNVDHLVRLRKDADFRAIYEKASLVIADGMPLVWASRFFKKPLKGRVAGSDMLPYVCRIAVEENKSIYIMGTEEHIASKAVEILKREYPGLRVAGHYSPPFGFENDDRENQKITELINRASPDFLFIALGAPKQEKWICRHIENLNIKVGLCFGAAIDFVAGAVTRAPLWMQKAGLEWLWRLGSDPKRLWKRYLVQDAVFLRILFEEWKAARRR